VNINNIANELKGIPGVTLIHVYDLSGYQAVSFRGNPGPELLNDDRFVDHNATLPDSNAELDQSSGHTAQLIDLVIIHDHLTEQRFYTNLRADVITRTGKICHLMWEHHRGITRRKRRIDIPFHFFASATREAATQQSSANYERMAADQNTLTSNHEFFACRSVQWHWLTDGIITLRETQLNGQVYLYIFYRIPSPYCPCPKWSCFYT